MTTSRRPISRKTVPYELKASGDEGHGTFEGVAAGLKNLDSYGDIIAPGAFAKYLPQFLDGGFIGGLNHNWDQPIGKPTAAEERGNGLYSAAKLLNTPHAQECRQYMTGGICRKLSIGFRTTGRMFLPEAKDVESWWSANGYAPSQDERDEAKWGATVLTEIMLYEYSPVMVPANERCDITGAKSSPGGGPRAGRTLDDQFLAALGTVEDFAERFAGYAERKRESGRPLPPNRVAQLAKVIDHLSGLKAEMARPGAFERRRMEAAALALEAELLDLTAP